MWIYVFLGAKHITMKPQTLEFIRSFQKMKKALGIGNHRYLFSRFDTMDPEKYEYATCRKFFERTARRLKNGDFGELLLYFLS